MSGGQELGRREEGRVQRWDIEGALQQGTVMYWLKGVASWSPNVLKFQTHMDTQRHV